MTYRDLGAVQIIYERINSILKSMTLEEAPPGKVLIRYNRSQVKTNKLSFFPFHYFYALNRLENKGKYRSLMSSKSPFNSLILKVVDSKH